MDKLVEKGILADVDLFFAQAILKDRAASEEVVCALAYLMAMARLGHSCVKVEGEKLFPSIEGEEGDKIRAGFAAFPADLTAVHRAGNSFYLQRQWHYEEKFCTHLKRLLSEKPPSLPFGGDEELNTEQKNAVAHALTYPLSIVTGGPGTGKTYTAARIVKHFLNAAGEGQIVLAAPTGKAAANLEKGIAALAPCQVRSGTLHALLQVRSSKDLHHETPFLAADLLIIDECSMIDSQLFAFLLSALESGKRIVLLGDPEQLPPVEGGAFFADLIESGVVPVAQLKICMRSDRQEILSFAQAIREGNAASVLRTFQEKRLALRSEVWDYVRPLFPQPRVEVGSIEELLEQANAFRILSCIRKGPQGVDALNANIAARFVDLCRPGEWLPIPILITRNSYSLRLFNGETGILLRKEGEEEMVYFTGNRSFPVALLPSFEYAYCLSVHKSQGSEFDRVLLLAPKGSEVFGREVLYTAVTRAKKQLEMDGDLEVIEQAMARCGKKVSGLVGKLRDIR